jgi:hypothetical protein
MLAPPQHQPRAESISRTRERKVTAELQRDFKRNRGRITDLLLQEFDKLTPEIHLKLLKNKLPVDY